MYTHMYLAECPGALSSAYAYIYVPSRYTCIYIHVHTYVFSRMPSRSFKRLCIHVCT